MHVFFSEKRVTVSSEHHHILSKAATRRFGQVADAYSVPSDPERRRVYDLQGHRRFTQADCGQQQAAYGGGGPCKMSVRASEKTPVRAGGGRP